MKYLQQLLTLAVIAIIITSCKKEEISLSPISSLNITNAIVGGTTAKFGNRTTTISNNNFTQFVLNEASNSLYIFPSTDSLKPYYNNVLTTNSGEVYSLFLGGTPLQVDAILVKDNIPVRTDSSAGIRFINLSPNSAPLNITLSISPTVNQISNLAYKQYSEFKSYPSLYNSTYTFQIRDASTAAPASPRATFSLSASTVPRFANITLVIRQNGSGVAVFRVNNDR